MKQLSASFVAFLLMFTLAVNVSAAQKERTVQVMLNGSPVEFQVPPIIIDNYTFVEFRSLFEKLGYTVDYVESTKTIHALSAMHEIRMSLGGDVAFVDGQVVPINDQMKIVQDRTMVGLRFVTELSGMQIGWDPDAFQAIIVDDGPTPEQLNAVFELLDQLLLAEDSSDADIVINLFAADSPLKATIEKTIPAQMERVKTKTAILKKRIASYSDTEATLITTEDNVKVSGGYFANNVSDVKYTLRPDTDGQWKIYSLELLNIEYTNIDDLFDQAVSVPDDVRAGIEKVLSDQVIATKSEDIEAYLATINFEDEKQKEAAKQQLQQVFAATDSTPEFDRWSIVDYNNKDQATVVLSLSSEVKTGGRMVHTKVVMANDFIEINGQWLFSPNTIVLSAEQS